MRLDENFLRFSHASMLDHVSHHPDDFKLKIWVTKRIEGPHVLTVQKNERIRTLNCRLYTKLEHKTIEKTTMMVFQLKSKK